MRVAGPRALTLSLLVAGMGLLAACGGHDSKSSAAPGSPKNPLVANAESPQEARGSKDAGRKNEAGRTSETGRSSDGARSKGSKKSTGPAGATRGSGKGPGYKDLVDSQQRKPQSRFTPCNLVTKAQARAIVGAPVRDPLEAPQGPTCIYRTAKGKGFITVAVQSVSFKKLRPRLHQPRRIKVSTRTAYCGQYGQAMLYVPLSRGRVLSVAGPCPVARQFAAAAVQRVKG
jgi:hypothetical protein